jgi:Flp pilus assembly CpaF family ATPase
MTDDSNNHNDHQRQLRLRPNADKGREPQFVPGQMGRRMISLGALAERIEAAFIEEHRDSPALREADTQTKRLKLVLATTDYVLAVESVQLSPDEKADLIATVFSSLFGYGPLDKLFADERVTTISLEGADKTAVRYGHSELVSLPPFFHDEDHLRRMLHRLLVDAGAELREDQPIIETGLIINGRPVSLTVAAPPVSFQLTADIRLHPKTPPTFDDLIASGFVTDQAAQVLQALVKSPHGILIVGDPESGKTTLLSLLARLLPELDKTIAVERTGELRLPEKVERLRAQWPVGDRPGLSFGEQIGAALVKNPACILLDEVRADEPQTIASLLKQTNAPRQIWSFRGSVFAKRLQSALGMLARRADMSQGEDMLRALYQRLPFIISVIKSGDQLRLWSIGEWQFKTSPDYPTYVLLLNTENGELKPTGNHPDKPLALPDTFWN